MSVQVGRALVRRLLAVAALLLATQVQAQNWELGRGVFESKCDGCHAPADKANRTAGDINGAIGGGVPAMAGITFAAGELTNLVAYLGNINYPTFSRAPATINFTAVSAGLTRTANVTVTNNGEGDDLVVSATVSDPVNYAVNMNGCGMIPQGVSCDIIVTFRPQTPATFNGRTLNITHNALGGSSSVALNGTGLDPFTVAPASPLTFTPATAPAGTRTITITDNKGDRIRACRGDAASFNAPGDFTLDSPAPLDGNGCYTSATSGAPRTISLIVRFTSGAAGPRYATMTMQRVDAGGNPLAGTATVVMQLQGNPGPFATVNASSLFDAPADPGVEVDNDNTLTRTVTLFSQGSSPVPFNGSSFTISGPSAGEYQLAGTGCQALAQLPAYTVDPAPSCVVTVIFNPSDVGRRGPATLTIAATGANTNTVQLNGLGFRGPRLAVRRGGTPLASGDVVQFGAQTIGGLYPAISVTLNNGGTLGDLDVVLPAAGSVAGFTHTAGAGCSQLAPGANCTVELRFDPAAAQAYASPFTIQTRPTGTANPLQSFTLDLRGQGSATAVPVLGWTDTTGTPITQLAFADTDAGSPRTSRIRLANAGPGGARLQFANAVGLDASSFTLDTSDCGDNRDLFEGTSCEVVVQFAPSTAGLKTASIQYAAGAGVSQMLVVSPMLATSGTGIASATPATLQPSAATLAFGDAIVGSSATPLELRIANMGSRSVNVTGLAATAPFEVHTVSCPGLPFMLPPGGECTLRVSFLATGEGAVSGTLSITSDAAVAVTEVALTGRGEAKPDLSSGGCSIASGETATDPTLWALVVLAALVLLARRQARRRAERAGRQRA
jgi:MYXO-CTERM domain-containing protein